ncbi:MAG TPA: DUF4252 domain-containing protein [Paludibacteraceae bacterium]|jgi:hypothetical protein|nr:DUF4252 domain-containing protein [Paludibacteraceae bacterium]MDS1031083.1 DUF4252 domain-containing protein [Porphyromonadaceae sp. NP-X]NLJ19876.1 DUF4252 domain-containing protein [Bacteroidales bacterium]HOH54595.1 DUF4252 domain-containing protein [Paludibacteraceae bacterium]
MKRNGILILTILLLASFRTGAQTIDKFFDRYANDERFTYVTVGKGMMNLASSFGSNKEMDKNGKEVLDRLTGIKILTLENSRDEKLMNSVIDELDKVIREGKYETAVRVKDKNETVNIFFRTTGKNQSDMIIVSKERNEMSIIWMNGKMTKEEMSDIFSQNS